MSLAIGDAAPSFSLPTTSGASVALDDLAPDALAAVTFWCNHCPYVRAWEDRFNELAEEYRDGVAVVAINANDSERYPTDSFKDMVARATQKGYSFPYAQDATQEVARAYGAERTPEVFLLDRGRRLAYHGAIDDSTEPGQVGTRYLREAIEALLAGDAPGRPETPAVGCTIKWR